MFNNLIESAPHGEEMQRRSSFFVGTLGIYTLLFFAMGVASIFAYDARMDNQTLDLVTLVEPAPAPEKPRFTAVYSKSGSHAPVQKAGGGDRILVDDVNHPENVPNELSVTPTLHRGGPRNMPVTGSSQDLDGGPIGPYGDGDGIRLGNGTATGGHRINVDVGIAPDVPKVKAHVAPARKPLAVSSLLNGRATSLPKPPYPPLAIAARAHGNVTVQVLLDETGKVLSARAVSGHPLLLQAAERAALQARFSPTVLGGIPMKVSGTINYNFALQ